MNARVTVIVPTFQRAVLLRRALRSVISQTYRDFCVHVYDNASADETATVVAELARTDARVAYHRQPVNIGSFDNFVYGMERVVTEYFGFLSDDDVLFPDYLATAVTALDAQLDAMLFAGSTLEFSESGDLRYAPVLRWPHQGRYNPPEGAFQMLNNKHPTWTSVLFRSACIERVGLLDRAAGAPSDLDYELQVAAHFPILISYSPCAAFVRHDQAFSRREDVRVIDGYRHIAAKFAADETLAPDVRARMQRALQSQTQWKMVEIAVKAIVRGDDDIAREALTLLSRERVTLATVSAAVFLPLCLRVPLVRRFLQSIESMREGRRSKNARRSALRSAGSYRKFSEQWLRWTRQLHVAAL